MLNKIGNVQLMQKINRLKVLNYIREKDMAFRPQIAKETGLSTASVTNIVSYLMSKNIIESGSGFAKNKAGRRADVIKFNASAYNLICISVEHKNLMAAFCDLSGKILEKEKVEIGAESGEELILSIAVIVAEMIKNHKNNEILAVGIALSALVLRKEIYSAPLNLHIPLFKESLSEKIGLPVFVENITTTKAVWQFKNNENADSNVVFLDLVEGIGSVQFTGGAINRSAVGEIGHTTVDANGEKCVCGNTGCLETICSYEKLSLLSEQFGFKSMEDALLNADKETKEKIFGKYEKYLGIGISNLITIFNPDKLCINCEYFKDNTKVLENAVYEMKRRTHKIFTGSLEVEYVNIAPEEIMNGIALYMCDMIFSLDFEKGFID